MTSPTRPARGPGRRPLLAALALLVMLGASGLAFATRYRPEPVRAANAAGDSACLSCHADKIGFERTAHRLTSRPPTQASIAGRFTDGDNVLLTSNPELHFRMEATNAGFTQTAVTGQPPGTGSRTERFAYVVGSGRKGQTYVYRRADRLFQLPVSHWTGLGWVNSPGYRDGSANFDRPITGRCLECHATAFSPVAAEGPPNRFEPAGELLGITCEKCHAAGREHVARERSALRAIRGGAIVNPAGLSRARQLDGCALCHGGPGEPRTSAFSYVPGTPIATHLRLAPPPPDGRVDVHGNQVALLARSACFRESAMTCSTCHDVHRPQRDVTQMSGTCLTCHQVRSCGLFSQRGDSLAGRCVDCHMPAESSNLIIADQSGREARPRVRTHWIRVHAGSAAR